MDDWGYRIQELVKRELMSASWLSHYGKTGIQAPDSCPKDHIPEKQSITIRLKILEKFKEWKKHGNF
jgi:hypothetical protein